MAEMTPDEELFFQTGELPPGLEAEAAEAAKVQAEPKEANPAEPQAEEPKEPPVDSPTAALERMLLQEREAREEMQEQLRAITAALNAKQATPPIPEPNEEEDPLGATLHKLNSLNTQITELKTELTQTQQNNLMKQQFEQFTDSVRQSKAAFEATTPDFSQAYDHIRSLRTDDLRAAGAPEKEIAKILLQDELQIAQTALQRGKNPAEEMYAMAKRYGYVPKAATTTTTVQTPEQKIAALTKGQAAAKHPDRGGTDNPMSFESLKDASSADLNKIVQDDKMWNRIVGGKAPDDLFG